LCFGNVYIQQEGRPNIFAAKRDLRSLYSPRAERVLRILLNNKKTAWKIAELAEEAQVSLGQVSNVKKLLRDREWIKTGDSGFILIEPEQLLQEWEENYSFRKNMIRDFYSIKTVPQIESELSEFCNQKGLKYALTSFSGAARLALAVRYQRVIAYIEESDEDLVSSLTLKKVSSGANLSILTPYDEGIFYGTREINCARIASPIQIYLDVSSFRGRGEEAAQALLEQVIRPTW
jgi:hypothetical protein